MTLSDAQIERYSRQIILPEVGGRGQEALLRSSVMLVGVGELARATLPYLAGAGIGSLLLRPAAGEEISVARRLAERAVQINPDVQADVGTPVSSPQAIGSVACDLWCETGGHPETVLSLVRAAGATGVPIVAAGVSASRGWMSAGEADDACIFCGWLEASRGDEENESSPLTPAVVGTVAALLASHVIGTQLGPDRSPPPGWLRYDAETMTLDAYSITHREDCPACREAAGENPCHPTLDS